MLKRKIDIIKKFSLNKIQTNLIEIFLEELRAENKFINLVGKSTLLNPWDRHVCDSLQIVSHIGDMRGKIIDMGAGPGIPGIFLSIAGCSNVLMVESTKKKADFIKRLIGKLEISAEVYNKRIEELRTSPAKYIVSRALAPLNVLINYSLLLSNNETSLLFLKGRNVNKEIEEAKKNYNFKHKVFKSLSEGDGFILKIYDLKKND